jgi:GGDEF domain-containing protein
MTKSKLAALVEGLQPQVDQLAEVLSLELTDQRDYVQMLVDAQRKMAVLSEELAGESAAGGDDAIYAALLAHTGELTDAMQAFLTGKRSRAMPGGEQLQSHAAHYGARATRGFAGRTPEEPADRAALLRKLVAAANRCRARREELSLLIVEPNAFNVLTDPQGEAAGLLARGALAEVCGTLDSEKVILAPLAERGAAAIISDCERRGALSLARQVIAEIAKQSELQPAADGDMTTTLSVGVATVSVVPKNFDPARVLESAMRCLSAARACGTSAVKSIEV